jgi:hypothetical protein
MWDEHGWRQRIVVLIERHGDLQQCIKSELEETTECRDRCWVEERAALLAGGGAALVVWLACNRGSRIAVAWSSTLTGALRSRNRDPM